VAPSRTCVADVNSIPFFLPSLCDIHNNNDCIRVGNSESASGPDPSIDSRAGR